MMAAASETPISPVGVSKPELTISAPAVNEEPVGLDGTPSSHEKVKTGRRGSKAEGMADLDPEEREVRDTREPISSGLTNVCHVVEKAKADL